LYLQSVEAAVETFKADIKLRLSKGVCPNQRLVLAGFSHGALALHKLLLDYAATNDPALDNIDAAILVADPSRRADDAGALYGTASATPEGLTTFVPFFDWNLPALPPLPSGVVAQVCDRDDAVCNPSKALVAVTRSALTCVLTCSTIKRAVLLGAAYKIAAPGIDVHTTSHQSHVPLMQATVAAAEWVKQHIDQGSTIQGPARLVSLSVTVGTPEDSRMTVWDMEITTPPGETLRSAGPIFRCFEADSYDSGTPVPIWPPPTGFITWAVTSNNPNVDTSWSVHHEFGGLEPPVTARCFVTQVTLETWSEKFTQYGAEEEMPPFSFRPETEFVIPAE
jgi:hypothetical protein